MCGFDPETVQVFTGVHVLRIAPVCLGHTCVPMGVALECLCSHAWQPVSVSLRVMHTCAHSCQPLVHKPCFPRRFVGFLVPVGSRFSLGTKAVTQEEEEGLEA